jgi:hypothetical protein
MIRVNVAKRGFGNGYRMTDFPTLVLGSLSSCFMRRFRGGRASKEQACRQ